MADKIQIPVEIQPHKFDEVKQRLNEILDPKTLSADAQILFQSVMGSFDLAKAEMTSQMAENKFNIPKLNLKKIDQQLYSLIKKVQDDMGQALPEGFIQAQKELDLLNTKLEENERKQKSLIKEIESMPSVEDKVKSSQPGGIKKFGMEADQEGTTRRILELEKSISETKDKRKLGPIQKELEFQKKVLEIQRQHNIDVNEKTKELNLQQSAQQTLTAMAEVQRDKQAEALAAQKGGTDPVIQQLIKERQQFTGMIVRGTQFQGEYNKIKADSAALEKKEGAAVKGATDNIAAKATKVLGLNLVYQQLRKILMNSVRTIKDLDKALTDAAVVTSMSREQAWELVGTYRELAKTTGLATTEIAGVVTQFLRQGRSLADALELAEVAAKSAKVAGISANEAVNFLTSAVNGFGLAADQAEDIADKFAAVAARSATSFAELASAMSRVSPTAKSAGVSVDFMMGVIAKGIETTREAPENIGTAFKTIFARMREVTDLGKAMEDGMNLNRVEKALLSVGVPLRDVGGQFRNLENVLTDVGNKWETLTSVEQAYLATALAGSRQQPRLLAIFNDFARTKELIEISSEATGGLALQHMEYMNGMEAALTRLRTAWEGFVTAIVDADIVIGFFNIMQVAIEGVTSVITAIGPSATIMIGLVTALGTAYAFAGDKIDHLTKKIGENAAIQAVWNAINSTANTIMEMGAVFQTAKNYSGKQSIVQTKLQIRSLLVKNGVTADEAKIVALATKMQSTNTKVSMGARFELQKMIWAQKKKIIVEKIGSVITGIQTFITGLATAANISYTASLAGATLGLSLVIPLVLGLVAGLIQFIKGASSAEKSTVGFGAVFKDLGDIIKVVIDIVVDIFKFLFELAKISTMVSLTILGLALKFSLLNPAIKLLSIGMKAIKLVITALSFGFKVLGNFIGNFVDFVYDGVKAVVDFLAELSGLKWVMDAISWIIGQVGGAIDGVTQALTDAMTPLSDFGKNANKATVELNEFNKNINNIKRLRNEFDLLNKKASKTPEDLARMNSILEELKEVEIDGEKFNFVTEGVDGALRLQSAILDSTLTRLEDKAEAMTDDLENIVDRAVAAYGKSGGLATSANNNREGAFSEQGVLDAAKFLGQQYAKNFITGLKENDEISSELAMQLQSAVNTAIDSAPKSFFDSFITGSLVNGGNFEQEKLDTFIKSLTGSARKQLDELNTRMVNIAKQDEAQVSVRRKSLQAIYAQVSAYNRLRNELDALGQGAQDTFSDKFAQSVMQAGGILSDLLTRGFDVQAIISMQLSGVSNSEIQDFLVNTIDDISKEIITNAGGRALGTMLSDVQTNFGKAVADAFSQTGQGVEAGITAYASILRSAGFDSVEFEKRITAFSNAIVSLSAQATGELLEDQRKVNEKLFTLPEKIKKGDFKDYTDLVAQFGVETVNELLSGSEKGVAKFLETQTQKTLDGIEASIAKIVTTAEVLGRPLSELEEQEISMMETMLSYYQDIVSVEQLRTYQIKQSTDLLKESSDLMKLQENLIKFGIQGESPILKTLNDIISQTEELGQSKALSVFEADLARLSQFGGLKDGVFTFFDESLIDITAGKIALDNYTDSLDKLVNAQMQSYERQKKAIEDTFKAEADAIKNSNDQKWKALEYSDRLMETEEKIAVARRSLLGLSLSGVSSGMLQGAQKDLEKMQKERQKMIEQQMVEQAQKELEAARDLAIQELGEQQIIAMGNLTAGINNLAEVIEENTQAAEAATPSASRNTTPSGGDTPPPSFMNSDDFGAGNNYL